jgi:hypothetical protein
MNDGITAGALVGVGTALSAWVVANALRDVAGRAWRIGRVTLAPQRWGQAARLLSAFSGLAKSAASPGENARLPFAVRAILKQLVRPHPLTLAPLAAGFVAGTLARDAVLSPFLVGVGIATAVYVAYRRALAYRQRIGDDVKDLVEAFLGLHRVAPTTFAALDLALDHVPAGIVREAVAEASRRYQATRDPHSALRGLYAVPDPYLRRFTMILDYAGEQGSKEVTNLVRDLAARLRKRWAMRLSAQSIFASVRGTMAVLFGAAVLVISAAAIVPLWRQAYVASSGRRFLLMALASVALATAAYFDRRMSLDEETML